MKLMRKEEEKKKTIHKNVKRGQNSFDENQQMEWSPTAQMSWYYSTFVVF